MNIRRNEAVQDFAKFVSIISMIYALPSSAFLIASHVYLKFFSGLSPEEAIEYSVLLADTTVYVLIGYYIHFIAKAIVLDDKKG